MRLPLLWLHDYVDPGLGAEALAERLAMTGTEVDRVHRHGVGALEHFRIGKVLSAERHPDADRLTVCVVDVGEAEPHQIVCGAPNVAAGQTVAVASPGAIMPDGTRLKKAKLRGQTSNGMILAEDEVGIGTDHDGTMVLPDELAAGAPLADTLPIATEVLELEITPNRPDCLSIYGVAREVHAATGAPLAPPPWSEDPGTPGAVAGAEVVVEDPDLCPRFTARLFEDVTIGPSPAWLKARLMAAGQRPINNVVDITNYAMLLTGQPLHAFDFDLVAGGKLTVRRARAGETMTTLDDVERRLDESVLLIADEDGPTSIAGLMGGARSEVRETTTRVLMEAANWNGPNLQRTSTKLVLRTEASGRFEKGLAPEQAMDGQIVASKLMLELTGARLAEGTIDVGGEGPPAQTIRLRDAKTERLLGTPVPREEAARILRALEFGVQEAEDGLDVTVPAFRRNDVTREADLVEEVARLWGLEKLPVTLPSRRGASGRLEPAQKVRRRIEDALVGAGLSEAVGWSFAAPDLPARLRLGGEDLRGRPVRLRNPMSEEQSTLRTTLLGSLLDGIRRNQSRGMPDVRLFEVGAVYLDAPRPDEPRATQPLPEERTLLGALLTGAMRPASWREPAPPRADFLAAKGVLEALLNAIRAPWSVEPAREPFLHPGRAARVLVGGEPAGWLGELHPAVAAGWDVGLAAGFELELAVLERHAALDPHYRDLTSFPSVRQDRAWWFPATVAAADVISVVREAGGALLAGAEVFDVYRDGDRTSLAIRLEFRAADRTLTDEEVAQRRAKVDAAVAERLGGEPRG
ncbi:MAG TPA: phenylalanine--tRNA ligase subunit beta [Solirubrobacteraceae bacterium]|nr:phenylalanine--tRNA ligase subunit beta [Solirubrobacteraceae bacterium]